MIVVSLYRSGAGTVGTDITQRMERVYFQLTPSANYPALGDTLDFTQIGSHIHSSQVPAFVAIQSAKPGGLSGFSYGYIPGSTSANGKLQVLQSGGNGPLVDLGASNYPAEILNDVIIGFADFPRL